MFIFPTVLRDIWKWSHNYFLEIKYLGVLLTYSFFWYSKRPPHGKQFGRNYFTWAPSWTSLKVLLLTSRSHFSKFFPQSCILTIDVELFYQDELYFKNLVEDGGALSSVFSSESTRHILSAEVFIHKLFRLQITRTVP